MFKISYNEINIITEAIINVQRKRRALLIFSKAQL